MAQLAQEHGLRWVQKSKRYLGIRHGIFVQVSEWEGEIQFQFSSPMADIGDEILGRFAGFSNCADGGVPTVWINGLLTRQGEQPSDRGCGLSIDSGRMDAIGVETFVKIPDLMAKDLHAHGAAKVLFCVRCNKIEATTVGLLDYNYTPMCRDCWQDLQFQTERGKLTAEQSVRWRRVLPALIFATVLGAILWGFVQSPEILGGIGFYTMLLPAAWACGLCRIINGYYGGMSRMLRLSLFGSVAVSVLAGNVWGFRAFVVHMMEEKAGQPVIGPDLTGSIQMYFEALPVTWQQELPFIIAGLVGCWIGLKFLKGEETVDVQ